MKVNSLFHFLLAAGLLGSGTSSFAQAPALADLHPFQSQTMFRMLPSTGNPSGMIEVIPAAQVKEFKYHVAGNPNPVSEFYTALLYDKRNPLPAISAAGGSYTFYQGGSMSTTAADGTFVYKGKVPFTPKVLGGSYFTKAGSDQLVLVDSYGFYFDTYTAAPNIRLAGGNYFIDSSGFLTTIKSMGSAPGNGVGMMTRMSHMNFSDALAPGGNFFMKADGSIVTIASTTGFFSSPIIADSRPMILGGNYFIGSDRLLYTITQDGRLIKNNAYIVNETPTIKAYSFMMFQDGSFIVVDGEGYPHRTMMHVSTTGVQAASIKNLSSNIDRTSIYQVNQK